MSKQVKRRCSECGCDGAVNSMGQFVSNDWLRAAQLQQELDAIRRTPPAAGAEGGVPDGYVLVLREPTEAMQVAGVSGSARYGLWAKDDDKHPVTAATYRAMIAASPSAGGKS